MPHRRKAGKQSKRFAIRKTGKTGLARPEVPGAKSPAKRVWNFLWEDNSIWSWIANIVIAFVLIKFLVYPGLGLVLGTSHPVVAVVSSSMEHSAGFDAWWEQNKGFYESYGMHKEKFSSYPLKNGFNKGDIILLKGANGKNVNAGDIVVFRSGRPDPIIHRVIKQTNSAFVTKGDNNAGPINDSSLNEYNVTADKLLGRAFFRIPLLGYIKILFVDLMSQVRR